MAENQAKVAIVLGGSGFLGSYVADELSRRGFVVRVFDKIPSPYILPDQQMIVGDITNISDVQSAINGCDYVFNFASVSDIEEAASDPIRTATVNVLGVVNSIEASRNAEIRRYVLASSVYVYSRDGGIYKASKQSAESFVEAFHQAHSISHTILRYGSLYGRRSGVHNTIGKLVRECLEKKTLTYYGNENAVREYIHVEDAARLSVDILDDEFDGKRVLLTGTERLHVREIMEMIAEIAPDRPEINIKPPPSGLHYAVSPYSFQPRLGQKLTVKNFVDIGQGILDCFEEAHEQTKDKRHHNKVV